MPGKNSKQVAQKTETPVETNVVEAAPVVASPAQKGGKKSAKATTPVVNAPETTVAVATETPAAATTQKGGKKAATKPNVEVAAAPAVAVAVVEVVATPAKTPAQKGGKKASKAVTPVTATETPVAETESTPAQKGGNKAPAKKSDKKAATKPKTEKKVSVQKVENENEETGDESDDRHVRSFKVQLPGKEEFEGRFTGLTPYQAANKTLSKYFRETKTPLSEITFSICESTRKSKKSVYTYVGDRQKLEVPVSYTIIDPDGLERVIVKNFKNSLKKVKKSEKVESAVATA